MALVQRGTCSYQIKVTNAAAAGYEAVIIFNEGQEGRREVLTGTLGAPVGIPVVLAQLCSGRGAARAGPEGPSASPGQNGHDHRKP